jgi:prophage regulatory protein
MSTTDVNYATVETGATTKHRIMRLPEVKAITGLSRSTIYFRIALNTFPKQISLGGRAVGWLEQEIQEWLRNQIEVSRQSSGINGSLN